MIAYATQAHERLIFAVRRKFPGARLTTHFVGETYGDGTPKPSWVIVDQSGNVVSGMPTKTSEEAWRRAFRFPN